jgi:hypothetical protein
MKTIASPMTDLYYANEKNVKLGYPYQNAVSLKYVKKQKTITISKNSGNSAKKSTVPGNAI